MGLADGGCGNVPPRLRVGTDADLRLPAYPKQVEPKHRFTEHVGEVGVELEATTEAGIFEAGLLAFAELLAMDEQGESVRHEVELAAPNRALLLVDWFGELIFLAEVKGLVPARAVALELRGNRLRASIEGRRDHPRQLVKAATLSNLEFRREGGIWHGRIVLDV